MASSFQITGIEEVDCLAFHSFPQCFGLLDPATTQGGIRVALPPSAQIPFRFTMPD
jgi:hypothetical protein